MTLVIVIGIALVLFGLAFASKRRFGILGLGLAAGVLLSQSLASNFADILEENTIPIAPLTYDTAAIVSLILVPSLLLTIGGPSYHERKIAIIGAALYALLGTMLILGPLTVSLPTADNGVRQVLNFVAQWQDIVVAVGVAIAVIDLMLVHGFRPSKRRGKH